MLKKDLSIIFYINKLFQSKVFINSIPENFFDIWLKFSVLSIDFEILILALTFFRALDDPLKFNSSAFTEKLKIKNNAINNLKFFFILASRHPRN